MRLIQRVEHRGGTAAYIRTKEHDAMLCELLLRATHQYRVTKPPLSSKPEKLECPNAHTVDAFPSPRGDPPLLPSPASSQRAKDAIIDLRSRQTRTCLSRRASFHHPEPYTSKSKATRVKGYRSCWSGATGTAFYVQESADGRTSGLVTNHIGSLMLGEWGPRIRVKGNRNKSWRNH